ncbi:hypothetical protein T439DRAFT_376014 [Meredithblackwellia eburnea MCA 4105]
MVHTSKIRSEGVRYLRVGEIVEYTLVKGPKGFSANDAIVLSHRDPVLEKPIAPPAEAPSFTSPPAPSTPLPPPPPFHSEPQSRPPPTENYGPVQTNQSVSNPYPPPVLPPVVSDKENGHGHQQQHQAEGYSSSNTTHWKAPNATPSRPPVPPSAPPPPPPPLPPPPPPPPHPPLYPASDTGRWGTGYQESSPAPIYPPQQQSYQQLPFPPGQQSPYPPTHNPHPPPFFPAPTPSHLAPPQQHDNFQWENQRQGPPQPPHHPQAASPYPPSTSNSHSGPHGPVPSYPPLHTPYGFSHVPTYGGNFGYGGDQEYLVGQPPQQQAPYTNPLPPGPHPTLGYQEPPPIAYPPSQPPSENWPNGPGSGQRGYGNAPSGVRGGAGPPPPHLNMGGTPFSGRGGPPPPPPPHQQQPPNNYMRGAPFRGGAGPPPWMIEHPPPHPTPMQDRRGYSGPGSLDTQNNGWRRRGGAGEGPFGR